MTSRVETVGALAVLLISGCAAGDAPPAAPEAGGADSSNDLTLAAPKDGVQVQTVGHDIPAGGDQEWCEVVELPDTPGPTFFVGRTELAMTPFSHHLVVSIAPDQSKSLEDAPLAEPAPCEGAHSYGSDLVTLAASAQPYVEQRLPPGIGYELRAGQRLLFDYHTLNTSSQSIHARHRLNLHFVDHVDKRARVFGFYNQYIDIPAHTARSFSDSCAFKDDLLIWALTRHTHSHGTDFRVFWAGGEHDGELIWTSTDWEQDIVFDFPQPVVVPAGVGFRWECAFDNTTDAPLQSGLQATDEMCILFGAFAAVGDDAGVGPQSCYRVTPPP